MSNDNYNKYLEHKIFHPNDVDAGRIFSCDAGVERPMPNHRDFNDIAKYLEAFIVQGHLQRSTPDQITTFKHGDLQKLVVEFVEKHSKCNGYSVGKWTMDCLSGRLKRRDLSGCLLPSPYPGEIPDTQKVSLSERLKAAAEAMTKRTGHQLPDTEPAAFSKTRVHQLPDADSATFSPKDYAGLPMEPDGYCPPLIDTRPYGQNCYNIQLSGSSFDDAISLIGEMKKAVRVADPETRSLIEGYVADFCANIQVESTPPRDDQISRVQLAAALLERNWLRSQLQKANQQILAGEAQYTDAANRINQYRSGSMLSIPAHYAGVKSANWLWNELQRYMELDPFYDRETENMVIGNLGVRVKNLAKCYPRVIDLAKATYADLEKVRNVGDSTIKQVIEYFRSYGKPSALTAEDFVQFKAKMRSQDRPASHDSYVWAAPLVLGGLSPKAIAYGTDPSNWSQGFYFKACVDYPLDLWD